MKLTSEGPDISIRYELRQGDSAPEPGPDSTLYSAAAPISLEPGTPDVSAVPPAALKTYTVSARAFKDGLTPSRTVSKTYKVDALTVPLEITPPGGSLYGSQTLTITSSAPGADIRFETAAGTIDGTPDGSPKTPPREPLQGPPPPEGSASLIFSAAAYPEGIPLAPGTVKTAPETYTYWIRAFKSGMYTTSLIERSFIVYPDKTPAPAAGLSAGNHREDQTLTLSAEGTGATIIYTITQSADGTEPADPPDPVAPNPAESITGSDEYPPAGIPLTAPTAPEALQADRPVIYIVKTRAFAEGKSDSDILRLRYEIRPPQAASPLIQREPGDSFGSTLLKLSSPTPGTEIRYTISQAADGTAPPEPADPVPSDPSDPSAGGPTKTYDPADPPKIKPERLNQPKTFRIKARAFKTGLVPSDVSSETIPLEAVAVTHIAAGGSGGSGGSSRNNSVFLVVNDGTLWGIGDNEYGQLGNGETITAPETSLPLSNVLSQVKNADGTVFNDVKFAAVGGDFTAVLKNDGSVWTFGRNNYGQLGDGTTTDRLNPVKVRNSGITSIAAGLDHLVVVDTAGRAYAVGRNNYGQLGNSSTTDRSTFVQMRQPFGAGAVFVKASAGWYHSLLLDNNGGAWGAGLNSNTSSVTAAGTLGVGTTANESELKSVKGPEHVGTLASLRGVKDIWGFGLNSVFLMNNGELRGSGANGTSQLGRPRPDLLVTTNVSYAVRLGKTDSEGNLISAITNADKLPTGAHGQVFLAYIDKNGRLNGAGRGRDVFPSQVVAESTGSIPFSVTTQFSSRVVSFSMAVYAFSILQTADGKIWVGAGVAPLPGIRSALRARRFQEYNPLRY